MGGICTRLNPECILLESREREKEAVIRQLVNLLAEHHTVSDPDQVVEQILEREELASTCLGFGCAVPHAHTTGVDTTVLAAARLVPPIECDTPDGEPVSLMFLMAGPENSAGLHIRLLSKLARLLHDDTFREELRSVNSQKEFYDLICKKDG